MNEKEQLEKMFRLKSEIKTLDDALSIKKAEFENLKNILVEYLEDREQTSTGKYAGLGHLTIARPRIFASFEKEDEASVFYWLSENGLTDLIKRSVNSNSLSSVVSHWMEEGMEIPSQIKIYSKNQIRMYKS